MSRMQIQCITIQPKHLKWSFEGACPSVSSFVTLRASYKEPKPQNLRPEALKAYSGLKYTGIQLPKGA